MGIPSFKDVIAGDLHGIFLNTGEFAGKRTVIYDGEEYRDIPVSLQELETEERQAVSSGGGVGGTRTDGAQGLFLASAVLYCAEKDLGGKRPKRGAALKINTRKGGTFFRKYTIAASSREMGMLCLELEAVGE